MAMLYTPQQMAGGPAFSGGVRIGNFYEDQALQESKTADFLARRDRGQLLLSKVSRKQAKYLQSVPHSYAEEGCVQFGFTVMLVHEVTAAAVACDPTDRFSSRDVPVTGQPRAERPVARNTLVVSPAGRYGGRSTPGEDGGPLLYGQPFMLTANPSLLVDDATGVRAAPLYLASFPAVAATGRKAPLSGHQEVAMVPSPSSETVWVVRAPNVSLENRPVPANSRVVLLHRATSSALAIDAKLCGNTDFGREHEVYCHTHVTKRRPLPLGHPARDLGVTVPVEEYNWWAFRTAEDRAAAEDTRQFTAMTPELALERVRATARERGAHGIRGIARAFRIMDDGGDGSLDWEDFKYGLRDTGVRLPEEMLRAVLQAFDRNGDGRVSLDEFLRALRGPMSARRRALVRRAFGVLDATGDGVVTVEDLQGRYDASQHPDVVGGRKRARDVLEDFMGQWDTQERDGVVTEEEFEEYYADVSASIDDDDYFELMIKNAWHLYDEGDQDPGAKATANTSNLRVLVTHYNGLQEVVVVKNDLGIRAGDERETRRRLEAQGVKEIQRIDFSF